MTSGWALLALAAFQVPVPDSDTAALRSLSIAALSLPTSESLVSMPLSLLLIRLSGVRSMLISCETIALTSIMPPMPTELVAIDHTPEEKRMGPSPAAAAHGHPPTPPGWSIGIEGRMLRDRRPGGANEWWRPAGNDRTSVTATGPRRRSALQQLQHGIGHLVGLSEHGGSRLLEHLGARHGGGLGGEVGIHDAAARGGLALDRRLQVGDHRLEAILDRAIGRALGGDGVDQGVDVVHRSQGGGIRADVATGDIRHSGVAGEVGGGDGDGVDRRVAAGTDLVALCTGISREDRQAVEGGAGDGAGD